jgi:hypothetical protein
MRILALTSSLLALALLGVPARAQATHSVKISWTDTTNPAGTTYNVYRASAACSTNPTLTKLNTAPITTQGYTDSNVAAGTYCYAATAVGPGGESAQSNQAPAVILAPPNAITITVTVS